LKNSFYVDFLLENVNLAKGAPQGMTKVSYRHNFGYIKLYFGVFAKLIDISICLCNLLFHWCYFVFSILCFTGGTNLLCFTGGISYVSLVLFCLFNLMLHWWYLLCFT